MEKYYDKNNVEIKEGVRVKVIGQFADFEEFTVCKYIDEELGLHEGEEHIKEIRQEAIEVLLPLAEVAKGG